MSQDELAGKMRELGHSFWQGTVAKLEGKAGRVVRLNEAAALAEILDFRLSEFVAVRSEGPVERGAGLQTVDELVAERKELLREVRRLEATAVLLSADAMKHRNRAHDYGRQAAEAAELATELHRRSLDVALRLQAAIDEAASNLSGTEHESEDA